MATSDVLAVRSKLLIEQASVIIKFGVFFACICLSGVYGGCQEKRSLNYTGLSRIITESTIETKAKKAVTMIATLFNATPLLVPC